LGSYANNTPRVVPFNVYNGVLQALGWTMIFSSLFLSLDKKLEWMGYPRAGTILIALGSFSAFLITEFSCHFSNRTERRNPLTGVLLLPGPFTTVSL
jgi:hypothetical protein